jgi:hypothetical protein
MSGAMIAVFAVACGLAVGNLYYAQPLLHTIGRTFGVSEAGASLTVTVTQLGYAAGLVLIAPLGDLLENRRLIAVVSCGTVLALVAAAVAPSFGAFIAASLGIGVTSVAAQILVPFAAHLAPAERRGRVVGQVMSGLLMGILLARAAAGVISGALGWRAVYFISAALLALTILVLLRTLPRRQPEFAHGYRGLVGSLGRIFREQPILRRRGVPIGDVRYVQRVLDEHHVLVGGPGVPSLANRDRGFRACRRGRRGRCGQKGAAGNDSLVTAVTQPAGNRRKECRRGLSGYGAPARGIRALARGSANRSSARAHIDERAAHDPRVRARRGGCIFARPGGMRRLQRSRKARASISSSAVHRAASDA